MSNQKCSDCGQLLCHGDLVEAVIVTRYVGLKSKLHYALEKPTACLDIAHCNCAFPAGENPDEAH